MSSVNACFLATKSSGWLQQSENASASASSESRPWFTRRIASKTGSKSPFPGSSAALKQLSRLKIMARIIFGHLRRVKSSYRSDGQTILCLEGCKKATRLPEYCLKGTTGLSQRKVKPLD